MKHRRFYEAVVPLIFMLLLFLNYIDGKENVLKSSLTANVSNSTTGNKHPSNISEANSTDIEAIPKPEALSWISDYMDDPDSLGRKPISQKEIDTYLKTNPSKSDNYYRNRNGEWIYIVPEEELVSDISRIDYGYENVREPQRNSHYREPQRNSHYRRHPPRKNYRNVRTYEQESTQLVPRYIKPVYRDPLPTYATDESGSFITKLINTSNGFLRYLNPLTYLRPKDPGPSYALYYPRTRQKYHSGQNRRKPAYQDSHAYRSRPSSYSQLYDDDILTDFDKDADFEHPSRYDDFGYEDEVYEYVSEDKSNTNYKKEFEFDSYIKNHKTEEEPYPSPPPSYDPRIKTSPEHSTPAQSSHTDLTNIYKFLNLDTLYDSQKMGSIENVQDQQTLDYLKENALRDDLYIGKDGNLYIKDSIKKRIDRFGETGQRTTRRETMKRKVPLTDSKEKELKRSSYTTITRPKRIHIESLTTVK